MKITLSPMRLDAPISLSRKGDVLIINDTPVDLSKAEDCPWIVGTPTRTKTGWELTLILPHGAHAPKETLFPDILTLDGDGPVTLPQYELALPDDPPPPARG